MSFTRFITILIGFLAAILLISQYQYWFGYANKFDLVTKKAENLSLEQENIELSNKYNQLQFEIEDLNNGGKTVEEYARQNLSLIKKDEIFVQYED